MHTISTLLGGWCEKAVRGCLMAPQLPSIWHPLEGPGIHGCFRLIRAQTGRFDLRYDSGYDSRVWIAARKTFISSTGRQLGIEPNIVMY